MAEYVLADRDLGWLSFNGRLLDEADKDWLPLGERIKFLSIYSSNLDEFYRVRMPAMLALQKIRRKDNSVYREAASVINQQQVRFGGIINDGVITALAENGFRLLNSGSIPLQLHQRCSDYFFNQVAGFLQPVLLAGSAGFFPENNQLYLAVIVKGIQQTERIYLVNIPCNKLPRFLRLEDEGSSWLLFMEDVIRLQLEWLFPGQEITGSWNIKITRDAELNLEDEYGEDLAEKIEKQLSKRDQGYATRLLYEPGFPLRHLEFVVNCFSLQKASIVEGGRHHNLKDLAELPLGKPGLLYPDWPPLDPFTLGTRTLYEAISGRDLMVHAPYHSYAPILRFFNEAANDTSVEEISTTLYRVASDSRIAEALISAAKNGKRVFVLVELKARFDEANNIRWAKKMKSAGVRIMYSSNALKVHAKIALVKRRGSELPYLGLLATGNLNETTARFYTDHILLTANQDLLSEMEQLFEFLSRRKKPDPKSQGGFRHLLVAQFNLQQRFLEMIDRETAHARNGRPAAITIKMNNLEEEGMITRLYDASNAGVKIELIVRGICRLVPGIPGQSEHIRVRRIIDRYLEHGRVFVFNNGGQEEIYMGSADWMTRNIYNRVEVCFPVYDETLKQQLLSLLALQLKDNVQAVWIDDGFSNTPVSDGEPPLRSQEAIYHFLEQEAGKTVNGTGT
ncbi:MAG: polyphosphate kinase 1 [Chitinophagaceae bacterium]|nr:MAG: polyphosphate kinase 1 [Chitinophagaceae bacterium]